MCLLIAASRLSAELPLVVAANRDERYDRLATASQVLRADSPRIVGGRDEIAGGTWLAINEFGVVAGLTNVPSGGYRDLTLRSRGELPILLAEHERAADAAMAFAKQVDPRAYNPCWLIVADRSACFYLDLSGDTLAVEDIGPGILVLENRPLHERSSKVERVTELLRGTERDPAELLACIPRVLADHHITAPADSTEKPNRATLAACVHTEHYGTRSSTIVAVGADPDRPPEVRFADGAPCTHAYADVSELFADSAVERGAVTER